MGSSKRRHPLIPIPRHLRGEIAFPSRTPGILGWQDAADPSRLSFLGDTPGPVGINDHASPDHLGLPCMRTIHHWAQEAAVHLRPDMQVGHYYPPGKKDAVLRQAFKFIQGKEHIKSHPYFPGGEYSGITIGAGYDIGQATEQEFRKDWAELALARTRASISPAVTDGHTQQMTPLDRLAAVTRKAGAHVQQYWGVRAKQYLPKVMDIEIPKELSIKVFKESLAKLYHVTALDLPGFACLPAGVQVALLSLVYNRGEPSLWSTETKPKFDDLLGTRWEMKQLVLAIRTRDLVWIYWLFESMRRVWVLQGNSDAQGLINRRDAELALIYPYVASDLKYEAIRQRFPQWHL